MQDTHKPFVPDHHHLAEITFASVSLGIFLAVILSAANTYLGLYAGMTVGASIPAAVISMGVLRGLLKRGNILENNIVQTIASTGESLSAGIIFTVPAMLLAGLWTEIEFWPTTIICITGGLLGILFMIPLRRSHIVEDKSLTFPEGVACAEVLKAGEQAGSGMKALFGALALGGVFKFLISGFGLMKGTVEWAFTLGRTGFYIGSDISVALLGVGYIVGANVGILIFLGGSIAWLFALPILGFSSDLGSDPMNWFWTNWSEKIRYLGVGAMITGGLWSIFSIRKGIASGFREAIMGYKNHEEKPKYRRTEVAMRHSHVAILLVLTTLTVFGLYYYLIDSLAVTLVATV